MRPTTWLRMASVLLAVVLVASLTNWALTFSARRSPAEPLRTLPAGEMEASSAPVDTAGIARLLGAAAGSGGGIRALGVMAEGSSGRGIALIGVDGQPARAVRAGETIAPGVVLTEVRRDGVVIERSGALQQIRIAAKPAAPGILRAP
jgi:general secretion pathway protein C